MRPELWSSDKSRDQVTQRYMTQFNISLLPLSVSFSQQREVSGHSDTVSPDLLGLENSRYQSLINKRYWVPLISVRRCLYKASVTHTHLCHLPGPWVNIVTASVSPRLPLSLQLSHLSLRPRTISISFREKFYCSQPWPQCIISFSKQCIPSFKAVNTDENINKLGEFEIFSDVSLLQSKISQSNMKYESLQSGHNVA